MLCICMCVIYIFYTLKKLIIWTSQSAHYSLPHYIISFKGWHTDRLLRWTCPQTVKWLSSLLQYAAIVGSDNRGQSLYTNSTVTLCKLEVVQSSGWIFLSHLFTLSFIQNWALTDWGICLILIEGCTVLIKASIFIRKHSLVLALQMWEHANFICFISFSISPLWHLGNCNGQLPWLLI